VDPLVDIGMTAMITLAGADRHGAYEWHRYELP